MKHSTNTYTAKINAMTSTTNSFNLEYYKSKADYLDKEIWQLREVTGNRYGIITGCLHAILGYQQKYAALDPAEARETIAKAQAWMQWADMLPREKWLIYADAREIPYRFYELWKKYKESGTTQTFMTWSENK